MKDLIKEMTLAECVAYAIHVVVFGGILLWLLIASRNWDAIVAVTLSIAVLVFIITFRPFLRAQRFFSRRFARG